MGRLLEQNTNLLHGFKAMCRDLQKLYQRLRSLGSAGSGLPVRSHRQHENDRNAVNLMGVRSSEVDRKSRWTGGSMALTTSYPAKDVIPSSSRMGLGTKPIANLEKISADLQEIARKLEKIK